MNDRALDRLFRRFRDRHDGAALAAVFDATSRELFEVACHLIRDPVEAEDLVQATFLAAIRSAARYHASSPVKGWLYGILWREAAKSRRSAARSVDPRRLVERREPEPIESLVAMEIPAAVDQALEKIPRQYREVLDPLIREGRQPEEIAAALQRSPGTVRSQIHRGMERLRRLLPTDLVPVSGLAGISVRGLAKMRSEILQAAGFSPAVAAAAPALVLNATIGGLLMSKGVLVGSAAAIALAAAAWIRSGSSSASEELAAASSTPSEDSVAEEESSRGAGASSRPAGSGRGEGAGSRAEIGGSGILAGASVSPQAAADFWLARFNEKPDDWRHGWAVAEAIAKLPPDEALAIVTVVWPHLSVPVKEQVLKPFVFHGGHPHALKFLHAAATDPSLSVQGRAFGYLEGYAFQDFANDYEAYLRWAETYRDMPVKDVLTANAQRFVGDLLALTPEALAERVRVFDRLDLDAGGPVGVDLAAVMRDAGGLQALTTCLQGEDPEAKQRALAWSTTMKADETWLRTWVLPSVQGAEATDPGVLDASFAALARPDCKWATDPILEHLRRASAVEPAGLDPSTAQPISPGTMTHGTTAAVGTTASAGTMAAARALAEIGDPAAIPAMIEILVHDRSGRLNYDVGYFGLAKLTGVKWQESYDAAWWLDWWEKNSGRLPPQVQGITIRR